MTFDVVLTESEDGSGTCDAILVTQLPLGVEADMKRDAKDALEQELKGELIVQQDRDLFFVGNHRGLDLAGLSSRMHILEQKHASCETQIAGLKAEVAELKDEVFNLKISSKEYRQVRSRFISTFKRDILKNADPLDMKIIREVNQTVHGGDAVVDAMLYKSQDKRRDPSAYRKLYGLDPLRVPTISEFLFNPRRCPG